MSKTATTSLKTTIVRSTSSLLLSPSKRRRTDEISPPNGSVKGVGRETHEHTAQEEEGPLVATPAEIHRWTFTKAAIAPCYIRDIFDMRESGSKDMEFFWLGRIPCRTVSFVGLVVGVQVWEKRTLYTIDDGTAVIDCAYAHPQPPPPSPVKPRMKEKPPAQQRQKVSGPSFADYIPPPRGTSSTSAAVKRAVVEPPPPPKPIARVGQSVRIVGRVISRHDSRSLLVDSISRCTSFNDEPAHWLAVSELHRTAYFPEESLPPFVPPPLPSTSTYTSQYYLGTQSGSPSKRGGTQLDTQEPGTPASVRSSVASTNTSPSTVASASSPASGAGDKPPSPVRLRHPARLHTRDLTVHTLRIYIKHYMDNAPPPTRCRRTSPRLRSISPSPSPRSSQAHRPEALETPTKSSRGRSTLLSDQTPRPPRLRPVNPTGRPPLSSASDIDANTDTEDESDAAEDDDQVYGYTLSHLRRVPELFLLARRVVHAEAHRRAKEERKKAKADAERSHSRSKSKSNTAHASSTPASASAAVSLKEGDLTDAKVAATATKRLFAQAIRTLFQDGSVVLWDGPIRPLPAPALDPLLPSSFSSALWKANASTSTSASMSTSASASTSKSSRSFPRYDEWDEDAPLSEPEPGEEAYVPLTPAYFARVLERAIANILAEAAAAPPTGDATPKPKAKPKTTSLIDRLRAQEAAVGGAAAVAGPTAAELLAWLRNSDERWARVGLWSVEEALEWGRREGRLWCVGKGRWEVCG